MYETILSKLLDLSLTDAKIKPLGLGKRNP